MSKSSVGVPVNRGMDTARFFFDPTKASLIKNLVVSEDGTLKSMTGYTLYEPKHLWGTSPLNLGTVHAVFHGYFNGGDKEVLLLHAGRNLWCHWGAKKGWETLDLPRALRDDATMSHMSSFTQSGNGVIFSDGFGPPLYVDAQSRVTAFGFMEVPSTLDVTGPESSKQQDSANNGEGSEGYSWPGGLGTPGDRLNGERSHILRSKYKYAGVWEDFQGNYSAMSAASFTVAYGPKDSSPAIKTFVVNGNFANSSGIKVGGLTKAAATYIPDGVPDNVRYFHIVRTKDAVRNDPNVYYQVHKSPVVNCAYHDEKGDEDLVLEIPRCVPIPAFTASCTYAGSLVVVDGEFVRVSDPGFFGTFRQENYLRITADGRQGTAVFSVGGRLYAATESQLIDCTDLTNPVTLSTTIGVSGPKAWAYVPDGTGVVFVHRSGVYMLQPGAGPVKVSADIDLLWQNSVNHSLLNRTVAWYSPERSEVRIAVGSYGSVDNNLVLGYNAFGWRTYELGLNIRSVTVVDDLELVGGNDGQTFSTGQGTYTDHNLYVLEREYPGFDPVSREVVYETQYIAVDESAGVVQAQIPEILFQFAETTDTEAATIEVLVNFDSGIEHTETVRLFDVHGHGADNDLGSGDSRGESWGTAVYAQDNFGQRRMFWRRLTLDIKDVQRFKVRVRCSYPNQLELVSMLATFTNRSDLTARIPDVREV